MTLNGLYILMYGEFKHAQSLLSLWPRIQGALVSNFTSTPLRLEPHLFGWPLIAFGTAWAGALSALWLRRSWGYRATIVVGIASLFTMGVGALLALLALVCLWAPPTQRWLEPLEESDDV